MSIGVGPGALLVATNITPGVHETVSLGGLTFDADTLWATAVAMIIVVGLGLRIRAKATSGVPSKPQLVWELIVTTVSDQIAGSIGPAGAAIVPLAVALFFFILVANWFEALGIGSPIEWLPAPTGDINTTLALAIVVIIPVHIASISQRGPVKYLLHYVSQPFPIFLFPLNLFMNIVDEIAKPITLALRLFGNLLSGGLMLALIAALGVWNISHIPVGDVFTIILNPVWKLFDLFIGVIQAFIFSLLTILYFDRAMSDAH